MRKLRTLKDIGAIDSTIKKIILGWCNDDKDRNVIYKSNGDERYPEFKLYKMIARTVHNHTPRSVIENPYFQKYVMSDGVVPEDSINIDDYPSLQ